MKTSSLILSGLFCLIAAQSAMAQSRSEKKVQTERAVKEAIVAKQYKISVNYMQPMRGGSRALTSDYSLEVKNDSVFSYLPYFGVGYNIPYGGGKGLAFKAPINEYETEFQKKGKTKIFFKTANEEDKYEYCLTIYPSGSTSIHVQPTNRQAISFSGDIDIKK